MFTVYGYLKKGYPVEEVPIYLFYSYFRMQYF